MKISNYHIGGFCIGWGLAMIRAQYLRDRKADEIWSEVTNDGRQEPTESSGVGRRGDSDNGNRDSDLRDNGSEHGADSRDRSA